MKNSKLLLFSFFVIIVCSLSLQNLFALDVIIRKDDPAPGQQPRVLTSPMKVASISSVTYYPVWADLTEGYLSVFFDKSVGIAQISVEDQFGMTVYQETIDTHTTLESFIDTIDWVDGTYVLRISYGSTKLKGSFELNNLN